MRALLVGPLTLLLASGAWAERLVTTITLAGSKIGQNVWEDGADGAFTSRTEIAVGNTKIVTDLVGTLRTGTVADLQYDLSMGKTSAKVVWKAGKLSVWHNGKEDQKDIDFKPSAAAWFGTYHPQLARTIWSALKGKTSTTLDVINLDSLSPLKMEFRGVRGSIAKAGGQQPTETLSTNVSGIDVRLAFTPEGKFLGLEVPSQKATFVLEGYEGAFADPLAKYPELSQPTFKTTRERRVRMTARDGARLMADLERPDDGSRHPTVLVRTPYGRGESLESYAWLAKRGYVVMCQDVRGRGGSDGDFDPLVWEKKDGYDTLDWIARQPWSDGKVGMIGGSYLGYVQWAAAATHHPALRCIIPQVSPPPPDRNFPWENGAFMLLGDIWWTRVVFDRSSDTSGAFAAMTNLRSLRTLPLTQVDDRFHGKNLPFWDKWIRRSTLSDWGDVFTLQDVASVKIPVMHVSGVWDGDGIGTKLHWETLQRAHGDQWLVFGPWSHLFNSQSKLGDNDYGPGSVLELDSVYLRFFDEWLKGKKVDMERQPRVRFFVTGSNRWVEAPAWPPAGYRPTTLYLSGGKANGSESAGTLKPRPGVGKDAYVYDPNHPAFNKNELEVGPGSASFVLPKKDLHQGVLSYRSDPMGRDTTVTGLQARLYVSSTAKDATFHVMALDEDSSGKLTLIGLPGTTRATYKNGRFSPLTPGRVYSVDVEPWWFAHNFKKGHRLRLLLQSDLYPKFARNPGTGEPDWKATRLVKATETVWKDPRHPSQISFWTD